MPTVTLCRVKSRGEIEYNVAPNPPAGQLCTPLRALGGLFVRGQWGKKQDTRHSAHAHGPQLASSVSRSRMPTVPFRADEG